MADEDDTPKEEILRQGLHIRSSQLKKLAPTFYYNAKDIIFEFELVKACVSDKNCPLDEADPFTLVPEEYIKN